MTTQVQKAPLTGSPDDIRKKLEELSRGLAPQEYSAGERFRALVVELARHADIQMWVLTYWDESQELEVTLSGDPHCDAIIINHDKLGSNCPGLRTKYFRCSSSVFGAAVGGCRACPSPCRVRASVPQAGWNAGTRGSGY